MIDADTRHMLRAIELARHGDPSPNPHVGCVIADGEEVVAEGYHEAAGGPHAEIVALAKLPLGGAVGKTLYVTLEPCNHQGRTGPCTKAIIAAGITRVVVASRDPNPEVLGRGVEELLAGGIDVTVGVCQPEAAALIRPWVKHVKHGTAYLSLKLAVSLDGRIATRTGASQWITCDESRAIVHGLRAQSDAVMVGIGTVIADDPQLTVRDTPGRSPVRVVVDSNLRIPLESKLVKTAREVPTCVITTVDAPESAADRLIEAGVSVIRVSTTAEGRCDLREALQALSAREVVTVLCEGGAELAGTLLSGELVDEMHLFIAPVLLGPRGRAAAVDWAGPETPQDAPRIDTPQWELCGTDAHVHGPMAYPRRRVAVPPVTP